uniref:7TM_GPCR_Srx domain-containing protein n=1 Tax=Parastrongyloides trichosuri TaxID=131310 RepID=A0A0N4ZJ60_PARTI
MNANITGTFSFISIGEFATINGFVISVINVIYEIMDTNDKASMLKDVLKTCRTIKPFMNDFYRSTQCMLLIERFYSTYHLETYEEFRHPLAVPFSIITIICITGIFTAFRLIIIIDNSDVIILLVIDAILIILTLFLIYKNYKLKKEEGTISRSLTTKYQITENLQLATFALPIIIFTNTQQFFTNLIFINIIPIIQSKRTLFISLNTVQTFFFIILYLYIILYPKVHYYWIHRNINIVKEVITNNIVRGDNSNMNKGVTTKNQNSNQTNDIYFKMLHDFWDNKKTPV